jgi:dephospho-CoA kinase
MKKIIIGIIGHPGVGKDTAAAFLADIFSDRKTEKFSFSKILIEEYCAHLCIAPTHPNLQYIGDAIRPEWLHARAKEFIEKSEADVIVIPSIRRQADFEFIQQCENHILLGIETDEKLAFKRMKLRKEKPGEEFLTWEAYQILCDAPIDKEIGDLLKRAEKTVHNNGSEQDFKKALQEIVKK